MTLLRGHFGESRARDSHADGYRDFGELYRAHVEAVYRFAFRQLGTREEAEDVTAAVFEEALPTSSSVANQLKSLCGYAR